LGGGWGRGKRRKLRTALRKRKHNSSLEKRKHSYIMERKSNVLLEGESTIVSSVEKAMGKTCH
jgi:hypothetical protein